MKAKDYLEQYRYTKTKADDLQEKYNEIIEQYDSVGSGMRSDSVRPIGVNKPTERKVEKAQSVREAWAKAQLDAVNIRHELFSIIISLDIDIAEIRGVGTFRSYW